MNIADSWADALDALKDFTPDFMKGGRKQPAILEREEPAFAPQSEADQ